MSSTPRNTPPPYPGNGARLIRDKQNYFFVLRPEYGRELMFYNRHSNEGISISGILAAGPSIGIEKPYYVQLQPRAGVVTSVPYTPNLPGDIIGAGRFFQGFDKAKLVPGVHFKAALSFEVECFPRKHDGRRDWLHCRKFFPPNRHHAPSPKPQLFHFRVRDAVLWT